jgi:hypothetical protein
VCGEDGGSPGPRVMFFLRSPLFVTVQAEGEGGKG